MRNLATVANRSVKINAYFALSTLYRNLVDSYHLQKDYDDHTNVPAYATNPAASTAAVALSYTTSPTFATYTMTTSMAFAFRAATTNHMALMLTLPKLSILWLSMVALCP